MKQFFSVVALSLLIFSCGASKDKIAKNVELSTIHATIDLTQVVDDKAPVTINPGRFTSDTAIYRLPRVIQGSYSADNFGLYIEELKAIDYNGNALPVVKIDDNSWQIINATQLDKLEYYVNDTFELEIQGGIKEDVPFSPCGTNISPDNYVLNLHGFIGYFDTLKSAQYTLDVTAAANLTRTSALQNTNVKSSMDGTKIITSYFAPRYFDITDNPMMYGDLEVEEFMVGDIKIVLSVYSPNNKHKASDLKEVVFKMMQAQKHYLGDLNTTARYDIYLYLTNRGPGEPKGLGALEHHTSTVAVLRENATAESLAKSITDVIAHEFFHIVTPLTVHSEDVHYFDYHQPTFSKHLWMYEGVTEYFAQHFQIYEGLISAEDYYDEIDKQIVYSRSLYDDAMSFTEMSEHVLDEPFKANYGNVYQKGALIGMCLDIILREESNGNRSMLSLMKELSNKYGIHKPFNDESLIEEIVDMTYPSVGAFLNTYVVGSTPIDYSAFLSKVGLTFKATKVETSFIQSGSGVIFEADPEKEVLFFSEHVLGNTFWESQGVKEGDIIKSINGTEVSMQNARTLIGQMYRWKVGDAITVNLERDGQEVIIDTTLEQAYTISKELGEDDQATPAQIEIRKAWLNLSNGS